VDRRREKDALSAVRGKGWAFLGGGGWANTNRFDCLIRRMVRFAGGYGERGVIRRIFLSSTGSGIWDGTGEESIFKGEDNEEENF